MNYGHIPIVRVYVGQGFVNCNRLGFVVHENNGFYSDQFKIHSPPRVVGVRFAGTNSLFWTGETHLTIDGFFSFGIWDITTVESRSNEFESDEEWKELWVAPPKGGFAYEPYEEVLAEILRPWEDKEITKADEGRANGEWSRAMEKDIGGVNCGKCGRINDHFDDVGWFYNWVDGKYVAVCSTCCGPLTGDR